jgi:phage tail-like protein
VTTDARENGARAKRAGLDGLASPHPLGEALPALYQDDAFTQRFTGALDEVLGPVFLTLDNFDAYLDARLAPDDFLEWFTGWVGVTLDESWSPDRRRALVARAIELYGLRGTARGLREFVEVMTGVAPEIDESGGVRWSSSPGGELPGRDDQSLIVRVRTSEPIDARAVEAAASAWRPAHIVLRVEVVAP